MNTKNRYTEYLKKKLWKNPEIINDLFNNEEWKKYQYENKLTEAESEKIYAAILQEVLRKKQQEENRNNLKAVFSAAVKYAAAAVFLLIAGWIIYQSGSADKKAEPDTAKFTALKKNEIIQTVSWEQETNQNSWVEHVALPDSSVVTLYPHSTIKYEKGLSKPLRDIYLTGKAYFKVKRNPERPFSVYAGGLKTTALGTSFTINTKDGKHRTSVQLHTGKIVVSPELISSKQAPVYLTKAESGLTFDRKRQLASLMKEQIPANPVPETSLSHAGNRIMMKNIPLVKVISLLSDAYQVKIVADRKEIGNITYTGEVNTDKENIESVLRVICLINNMSITQGTEQEYILKLSKPKSSNK